MNMKTFLLTMLAVLPLSASRGIELYQSNQFASAEEVLLEEVAAEPANAKAWHSLGMTLLRLNVCVRASHLPGIKFS